MGGEKEGDGGTFQHGSLMGVALGAAVLVAADGASAAIIVQTGVSNAGTDNVLANACSGAVAAGTTVQGCLNQDHSKLVNFTGVESLTYTGVQALDAADGTFTYVLIALAGGGTFNKLLLNIDANDNGFVTFTGSPGGASAAFSLNKNGQTSSSLLAKTSAACRCNPL